MKQRRCDESTSCVKFIEVRYKSGTGTPTDLHPATKRLIRLRVRPTNERSRFESFRLSSCFFASTLNLIAETRRTACFIKTPRSSSLPVSNLGIWSSGLRTIQCSSFASSTNARIRRTNSEVALPLSFPFLDFFHFRRYFPQSRREHYTRLSGGGRRVKRRQTENR